MTTEPKAPVLSRYGRLASRACAGTGTRLLGLLDGELLQTASRAQPDDTHHWASPMVADSPSRSTKNAIMLAGPSWLALRDTA